MICQQCLRADPISLRIIAGNVACVLVVLAIHWTIQPHIAPEMPAVTQDTQPKTASLLQPVDQKSHFG